MTVCSKCASTFESLYRLRNTGKYPADNPLMTNTLGCEAEGCATYVAEGCAYLGHWMDEYGLGVHGCYQRVMQDPQCAKDYFSYEADENCGCKKAGPLEILAPPQSCHGASYYSIRKNYDFVAEGCAYPSHWMGEYGLGVDGCYQRVMQDPQCAKDYFSYGVDNNCSCKISGQLEMLAPPNLYNSRSYYSIRKNYDFVAEAFSYKIKLLRKNLFYPF